MASNGQQFTTAAWGGHISKASRRKDTGVLKSMEHMTHIPDASV
jgi:hypothetical protein